MELYIVIAKKKIILLLNLFETVLVKLYHDFNTVISVIVFKTYSKGGFAITWMEELLPEPSIEKIDSRAYNFAKEFPLWQLFELKPING